MRRNESVTVVKRKDMSGFKQSRRVQTLTQESSTSSLALRMKIFATLFANHWLSVFPRQGFQSAEDIMLTA